MMHLFFIRPEPGGFSDEDLQIAARAVQNAMLRSLEEDSEQPHVFSESFLERMRALFRVDDRRRTIRRALQHAAIIVIGIFLAGALLLAFNPEIRADFTRWVRNTYEKSFFYQFFSSEDSVAPDEDSNSLPDVEFGWLPGEYDHQKIFDDGSHIIIFLEGSTDTIILEYWTTDTIKYLELFTDDFIQDTVLVSGHPADFYQAVNSNTANALVWTIDNDSIVFYLNAFQSKDILIKIAENIK